MSPVIKTIGIRGLRVIRSEQKNHSLYVVVELTAKKRPPCPACEHPHPWINGHVKRSVRHLDILGRPTYLQIEHPRFLCSRCGKTFNPSIPAILPYKQSSEPFRGNLAELHHNGISASSMARLARVGTATVERIYHQFNSRKAAERISLQCPQILGIDEHTIGKSHRFATTFCDLRNRKIFDIVEGRSIQALEAFLKTLQGREKVKVVCIDLSSPYRNLIRRYFPNAKIVADRFHVIRLVIHHFMKLARQIAPEIRNQRGILNLLRKNPDNLTEAESTRLAKWLQSHPAIAALYHEMHDLRALLNIKHRNARQCKNLTCKLIESIDRLFASGFENMKTLARTLQSWMEPIARMWRFTKNNGITEGFHRKMKLIQRIAYGFRNFENYRMRVIAHCG